MVVWVVLAGLAALLPSCAGQDMWSPFGYTLPALYPQAYGFNLPQAYPLNMPQTGAPAQPLPASALAALTAPDMGLNLNAMADPASLITSGLPPALAALVKNAIPPPSPPSLSTPAEAKGPKPENHLFICLEDVFPEDMRRSVGMPEYQGAILESYLTHAYILTGPSLERSTAWQRTLNEGAQYWLEVLTQTRNMDMKDPVGWGKNFIQHIQGTSKISTATAPYVVQHSEKCFRSKQPIECSNKEINDMSQAFLQEHPHFNLAQDNCMVYACNILTRCRAKNNLQENSSPSCSPDSCFEGLMWNGMKDKSPQCDMEVAMDRHSPYAQVVLPKPKTLAAATTSHIQASSSKVQEPEVSMSLIIKDAVKKLQSIPTTTFAQSAADTTNASPPSSLSSASPLAAPPAEAKATAANAEPEASKEELVEASMAMQLELEAKHKGKRARVAAMSPHNKAKKKNSTAKAPAPARKDNPITG